MYLIFSNGVTGTLTDTKIKNIEKWQTGVSDMHKTYSEVNIQENDDQVGRAYKTP